jgi:hypothetical protein
MLARRNLYVLLSNRCPIDVGVPAVACSCCCCFPEGYCFFPGVPAGGSLCYVCSVPTVSSVTDVSNHKVRICKEYHSVCPLAGIGTLPTPFSPASVPLPPQPGGGGTLDRLRVRGWGSSNSDDLRKSLALCLLCVSNVSGGALY